MGAFLERNRRHWTERALKFGDSCVASWDDPYMIALEIETIGGFLKSGQRVLDAGCGNGYGALAQLKKKKLRSVTGIDFCPEFVDAARKAQKKQRAEKHSAFSVGDIRRLLFPSGSFDVVYTTRVLINLETWAEQKAGILECLRVVKKGGLVLLSEAFLEPYHALNTLRRSQGLPPLTIHDFNRYLDEKKLEIFLRSKRLKFQVEDFCSIYYLGSRFLRELVTDASKYPGFSNPVNAESYKLEKKYSGGGLGIQQLYVIRK